MHELERRIDFPCEWKQLKQDLEAPCEIEVKDDGKTWLLRSPLEGVAGKACKAVGVAVQPSAEYSYVKAASRACRPINERAYRGFVFVQQDMKEYLQENKRLDKTNLPSILNRSEPANSPKTTG